MCAGRSDFNGFYSARALTASGRPWFEGAGEKNLYWDPDCDGGGTAAARWIFDVSEPSVIAASDLDGDSNCMFAGSIDSSSELPPSGPIIWSMRCPSSVEDVSVTIADLATCPAGQEPNMSSGGCSDCSEGKHSFFYGTDLCVPCPAGRYGSR